MQKQSFAEFVYNFVGDGATQDDLDDLTELWSGSPVLKFSWPCAL